MNFWWGIGVAFVAQILVWALTQGFEQSYFGQQMREEITRFWNNLSKHMRKQK